MGSNWRRKPDSARLTRTIYAAACFHSDQYCELVHVATDRYALVYPRYQRRKFLEYLLPIPSIHQPCVSFALVTYEIVPILLLVELFNRNETVQYNISSELHWACLFISQPAQSLSRSQPADREHKRQDTLGGRWWERWPYLTTRVDHQ